MAAHPYRLPHGVSRAAIDRAAELIARGLADVDEFAGAFLSVALQRGNNDDISGLSSAIHWALADSARGWELSASHATNAALKAARDHIKTGVTNPHAIAAVALRAAERIHPGLYDLPAVRRLLADEWENHNHNY